ncbi:MAG: PAS domain-containing sensor histidine kinase [Desulfobacteraceae bacterium]|nr:MAG: PAS domain-containing sensor histidine kinase [Desulfobacteraceae bacterium]
MEEALRHSEIGYRTLVESMPGWVFVIQDEIIRYANPIMLKDLGRSLEDLVGKNLFTLIAPEERQGAIEKYRRFVSGEDTNFHNEFRIINKDGAAGTFISAELVPIDYDGAHAFLGTAKDITEQKRVQESLRESEEKFRRITENMRDVICQLDDMGRICYASPSYRQVLGYDPAELIGQSPFHRFHPDDVATVLAAFAGSLENRQPVDVTLRYLNGRGEFVWLQSTGSLLFDEKGKITGAVISSRDVTARKKAEGALQESEERFRSVAESTSDWIWEVDADCRFTFVAPRIEKMLGYRTDEVLGKTPFDFMPPEEAERVGAKYREIAASKKPFSFLENVNLHKDGSRVVLETSGVPILDAEGKFLGYRGVDHDVTQKRVLEAQAIRAKHLASIGELAAGVAHEINNPVTGIINYAQILVDEALESGGDTEIPTRIIREGERIAKIVRNLLSFARESNTDKQPLTILPLLEDSVALIASLLRKEGIAIAMNVPDGVPMIVGNRKDLQHVFLSIFANSRYALNQKYSGFQKEKLIEIKAEEKEVHGNRTVRITFHDKGNGISPEVLGRIFDPFFSTRPSGHAMGLGLSISYGIMKDHKGNIEVKSKEGEYTKVILDFPATDYSTQSNEPADQPASTLRHSGSPQA